MPAGKQLLYAFSGTYVALLGLSVYGVQAAQNRYSPTDPRTLDVGPATHDPELGSPPPRYF